MKNFFQNLFVKKNIFPALIVLFSLIFLVSAGFLADYFIKSAKQKEQYDALSQLVQQNKPSGSNSDNNGLGEQDSYGGDGTQENLPEFTTVMHPVTGLPMDILTQYAPVFELNKDLIGWIQIDGTVINYPVLQTPEWVNYYLKRDFNGQDSKYGAIYANEAADIKLPSDNVTIYGHRMKDGTMFAALHNYKDKAFFLAHPNITFDTIYERHNYKIISVFITTGVAGEGFAYHNFVDGDMKAFNDYVAKCKELSLYDTGVEALYGDKLITLSTCEHNIENGRLVVVAKRIS